MKQRDRSVVIYDTTLRDGSQAEGISLSKNDKLRILSRLDKLGISYVEGGWPGSNPKDMAFFREAARLKLEHSCLTAFGTTRRAGVSAEEDLNLRTLLEAETSAVAIVGKTWLLHVHEVLRVTPEDNLKMISDSCAFLRANKRRVLFDAEHFFDGWKDDPEYALSVLRAAASAGAGCVTLCDTNGGTLPEDVFRIVSEVRRLLPQKVVVGVHCHNDAELAVANSLEAVRAGARLVQGTINGFGERCGNANLTSIIPGLELKMSCPVLPEGSLQHLRECSRFVDETINISPDPHLPYVGESAFAHKGGLHVNAVEKDPATFEHVRPEAVGNRRRILVSDLSGKSSLSMKIRDLGISLDVPQMKKLLKEIKNRENLGYEYEAAEASFALLVEKTSAPFQPFFELLGFRVIVEKRGEDRLSEATVKVRVGTSTVLEAAESSSGPVNALDAALRKALVPFYPELEKMSLHDYKVRILSAADGTAAKTRVLIESTGKNRIPWVTVGVNVNIIDASREALVDSIEYALLMHRNRFRKKKGSR